MISWKRMLITLYYQKSGIENGVDIICIFFLFIIIIIIIIIITIESLYIARSMNKDLQLVALRKRHL